jgi:glycosyltransferase involved in cell wall biosynthesis
MPDTFETLLIGGAHEADEADSSYIAHQHGLRPIVIAEMRRAIHPVYDYRAYRRIREIIQKFKPDIVHTHASKAGALGRLAALHENVSAKVHTYHGNVLQGYFSPLKSEIFKGIERYLGHHTNALIAISPKQQIELIQQHRIAPAHKVHVIPLGFDLLRFQVNQLRSRQIFREKYGLAEGDIAIGIIGRMAPVKQHDVFIKAFASARAAGLPLKAFLIGDGDLRDVLETQCRTLGLTNEHIIFTSWIKQVEEVLHGLDIVALSSVNEGTPVSLIEAAACGKPVVSTKAGGTENVVLHEKTGLLCEIGDAKAMAKHLLRLAGDKDLRNAYGNAGRQFVMQHFSFQRLCNDMTDLYTQILK